MQEKLLSDLVEKLAGENSGLIVGILFNKKNVNEFLIAKRMELTINQVRNILYKLSNFGLVSFIRKKDNRKGWYIYYWTLNTEKSLAMIEKSLKDKIDSLEKSLNSRETERFFICKSCGIEVTEEKALEMGFSCEECAEIYELAENTKNIKDLKSKKTKIKNELETIKTELDKVREKLRKKKERANKKEEKELEKEKARKKEERKKARAKTAKKKPTKKVVKKAKKKVAKKKKVVKKPVKKKVTKKVKKKK